MIKYATGDILEEVEKEKEERHNIIAHVCNDSGGWGRGFVLALSKKWPEPESKYRQWFYEGATANPNWN